MRIITNSKQFYKIKSAIHNPVIIFLIFFFAASIRFLYYGFRYFPQLDDYIQYHNLAQSTDFAAVVKNFGLLASRPLSGIFDIFVWSVFWENMIVAVVILSALWTGSALIFRHVLKNYINCGYFFAAFYLLLPLNFEGTYWMSASTRIVCGMFLGALSLFLFEKWLSGKKAVYIPLWVICQLVSFCFYEQVLVLNGFMLLLFMFLRLKNGNKSALFGLMTFVNLAVYFIFTGLNNQGDLSARINTILPWQEGYFAFFLPDLLRQIGAAFLKGGTLTLFKGFYRGYEIIVKDRAWMYLFLIIMIAVLMFYISLREKPGKTKIGFAAAVSILLILAPLTPYFFILNPWFSLRAVVASFVGASLLFDTIFTALIKNRKIFACICALFVLIAGIASVSELHDYKLTYDYDVMVIEKIAVKTAGTNARTGILNLNGSYLNDQNYYYHEHIHGVIESDWALQGALYANYEGIPEVVPLATDGFSYYVAWNRNIKLIGGYDVLYWWDSEACELIALKAEGSDEHGWNLYDSEDNLIAVVWEELPYGYIKPEG